MSAVSRASLSGGYARRTPSVPSSLGVFTDTASAQQRVELAGGSGSVGGRRFGGGKGEKRSDGGGGGRVGLCPPACCCVVAKGGHLSLLDVTQSSSKMLGCRRIPGQECQTPFLEFDP